MKKLLQRIILLILITVLLCALAMPAYALGISGGTVGTYYFYELVDLQGCDMETLTLSTSGSVPPGLKVGCNVQEEYIMIYGTPTTAGDYSFFVWYDCNNAAGGPNFQIKISPNTTLIPPWTAPPTATPVPTLIPPWTAPPTATPTPTPSSPVFGRKPLPTATPAPTATPSPTDFISRLRPLPSPTTTPVATAAPTPTAAVSTMAITKHPTGEVVDAGGSATFIARADNYAWCAWRFVSPDGKSEVIFDVSGSQFPGLKVEGGNNTTMKIHNIPAELNGWKAVCLFSDNNGKWLYTDGAAITVKNTAAAVTAPSPSAAPATPAPTPTAAPTSTPVPTETSAAEPSALPAGMVEIPIMTPSPSPTAEPEKTDKGGSSLVTVLLAVIALLLIGGVAAFVLYSRKMKAAEERRMLRHFRCSNCGWSPKSLNDIPNFCPKCGDEFNEHDFRR